MSIKRALLLSAYDAQSHRYWREHLVSQFQDIKWQVLTLPPRHFAWRIRGNSLSWAFEQGELLACDYDLIVATSMCDLSALRGFCPKLANTPTLVYFHENQFAYPLSAQQGQRPSVEPQILNIYTALCADYLAFNSEFNRRTFFQGASQLLQKLPDHCSSDMLASAHKRSCVLPVPLSAALADTNERLAQHNPWQQRGVTDKTLKIAWAARWEYDKGPEQLMAILNELDALECPYALSLMGQRFRNSPKTFNDILERFASRIVHAGFVESRTDYLSWLRHADVMLSSAKHEFQGLSVLEAVQAGCVPIVPNDQAYPELFESRYRYDNAKVAAKLLSEQQRQPQSAPQVEAWQWPKLRTSYQQCFIQTLANFADRSNH